MCHRGTGRRLWRRCMVHTSCIVQTTEIGVRKLSMSITHAYTTNAHDENEDDTKDDDGTLLILSRLTDS